MTSNVILGRGLDDTLSGLQTEHDETVEARVAGGLECAGYGLGVSRLIELQLQPQRAAGHLCSFEGGLRRVRQTEHAQAGWPSVQSP